MPTTDTWSAEAALSKAAYSGRIRSWVTTPNFGSLPKDSKPVNPYSDRTWKETQVPVTAFQKTKSTGAIQYVYNNSYTKTGAQINSDMFAYINSETSWNSDVASVPNAVKLKALVKIADAKVNVAVALAEARKTSDLIYDTARRIDKAYRAFRRGHLGEVAKILNITPGKIHNSWLEYKYGWMPLLMDVKGAAEFFAQQHVVRSPKFQVSALETVTKTYPKTTTHAAYGSSVVDATRERFVTASYTCRAKIWCELSNPHLSALQQIGLTNPALVAWELVPFSFVFDWFISVGDWLTGLTALDGVTVRRAMISQVLTYVYSDVYPPTFRSNTFYEYTNGRYDYESLYRQYQRDSYIPDPLSLHPPVNVNSFGFAKLVTSLALLRGSYRGSARL